MNKTKNCKREILKEVPLYKIKPYHRNYQDHSENVQHIANSIRDFGFAKVSLSVDENMVLLAGHGTLAALEKLDYKKAPLVLQVQGLTEKQKMAFRISDNESSKNVTINDEFLRLELDDIGVDFDMRDYGLLKLDIDEINKTDENAEWNDMPEFKEGEKYIKLTFIFENEDNRNSYIKENNINVDIKMNDNNWICHK